MQRQTPMPIFSVTGPYGVPVNQGKAARTITPEEGRQFWQSYPSIASKRGCYVFCIRAGRGISPIYVGKATHGFKQEVFTPHKLTRYQQALTDYLKGSEETRSRSMSFDLTTTQKVAAAIGLPTAGALAQHLWSRYRRRLVVVKWTVQYRPMAFATEDFGWGKVQILYNNLPTQNLHMINVQLQNTSTQDLENVRLDVFAGGGTVVLRSQGALRGSLQSFPFAQDYLAFLSKVASAKHTAQEFDAWAPRSPFIIPVLNRGAIADFALLVSRQDHATPQLVLGCDHKGLRLAHQPLTPEHMGVRQDQAGLVGLMSSLVLTAAALVANWATWAAVVVAWFSGAFAMSIGAIVMKAWRRVVSLAD